MNIRHQHGRTPLMLAVKEDHVQCVKKLIKAGADVNIPDKDGLTPLMIAVKEDRAQCVNALIKAGANLNIRYNYSRILSLLLFAVKENHPQYVKELAKAGADVNIMGEDCRSPLMYAVKHDHVQCVNELIKAGASVNVRDRDGFTALMLAAKEYHVQSVITLIKAGADVNMKDIKGNTALNLAAITGNEACLKLLIEAGADVNIKNKWGQTALFYASDYRCMNMLLEAGADVNITDNDGNTALHFWENPDYGRMDYRDYLKNCRQNVKNLLRIGIHINIFNTSKDKNALETLLEHKYKYQNLLPVAKIYYQDAAKFLYVAGETLEGTEEDKIPEVLKFEEENLELKHICREAIRKHLLKLDPHQHLFGRIPKLGLPSILTEYLLFNQSLDDDDDYDHDALYMDCCYRHCAAVLKMLVGKTD